MSTSKATSRTAEFKSCVETIRLRSAHLPSEHKQRLLPSGSSQPAQRTEFARQAAQIGKDIQSTTAKLGKLAQLAKRKTLFDDRPVEISELTYIIKQDINNLNAQIAKLQLVVRSGQAQAGGSGKGSKQVEEHNNNVVMMLQGTLAKTSMNFKDVLEVRTQNMKATKSRTEQFGYSTQPGPSAGPASVLRARSTAASTPPSRPDSPLYAQAGTGTAIAARSATPLGMTSATGGFGAQEKGKAKADGSADFLALDMGGGRASKDRQQDNYLGQRSTAIESIESTIAELGSIFSQLATMVAQQGETVQRIDADTHDIATNVQGAQRELLKYLSSVQSNRWLMLKVFGLLTVFFLIFEDDLSLADAVKRNAPVRVRLLSLDLLRGLLIVLMAIDHASLFLGNWAHGGETYSNRVTEWPTPLHYTLRTLTHACAPGFVLLLGIGNVYFLKSRLRLQWKSPRLIRHFVLRGFLLLFANQALTIGQLVATRFQVVMFTTPLWMLGWVYALSGIILLALTQSEDALAARTKMTLRGCQWIGDTFLAASIVALQAMTVLLCPSPDIAVGDRSFWFYALFQPVPATSGGDWSKLAIYRCVLFYSPIGWLSFALLGLLYGRWLSRKTRTESSILAVNIALGVVLFALFVSTRVLRWGNTSDGLLPSQQTQTTHLPSDHNPYYTSVFSFLYSIKYSPDVAYSSLWIGVNFLLMAALSLIPAKVAERLPLIVFGRTSFFFFIAHMLVFSYVSPAIWSFLQQPVRGGAGKVAIMYFGGLFGLYFACRSYLRFKDKTVEGAGIRGASFLFIALSTRRRPDQLSAKAKGRTRITGRHTCIDRIRTRTRPHGSLQPVSSLRIVTHGPVDVPSRLPGDNSARSKLSQQAVRHI
ncbi:hypothetical protein E5Q_02794 [Mixia osmundae IAM 14324]|uniref:t-SNARE coiled-coil homology domain-containing protein n=1 Tax=Mixia osmundae (strain CBS 9802 / IAM 14324 / JCM 22182 / KY 12970) TaxID=764103 RepID=G7DZX4_MIXOS|nr:hypothetical protein E5Q_02794 [Mixia osmundae IAM 14324]